MHRKAVLQRSLAALAAVIAMASTTESRADELRWREEWPRFRVSEAVATGVSAAGLATLYLVPRQSPTWGEPILFDGAIRNAWKADSDGARNFAQAYSTYFYYGSMAYPLIVDTSVALARGSSDVAIQTALIDLEVFAATGFVFRISEATVRRARPHVWECIQRTGSTEGCAESGLGGTNSFISGHVAIAAAGAGLMCTHHLNLKLYGSIGSPIACAGAIAGVFAVGYGRIVTDNHYMTDVLSGMVTGGLMGWLIPSLLHYGIDGRGTGKKLTSLPMPYATRDALGIAWTGFL
jgi:membrane-associated phospholipid phosphatase